MDENKGEGCRRIWREQLQILVKKPAEIMRVIIVVQTEGWGLVRPQK